MLPETINLKDAQAILSNVIEKDDFNALEITFRFIKNAEAKENGKDNGNGNGKPITLTPDEFIALLDSAKSVKHLFYIYYQNEKAMKDYSPADKNRINQTLNSKKSALPR